MAKEPTMNTDRLDDSRSPQERLLSAMGPLGAPALGATVLLLAVWALSGAGYFWPMWPWWGILLALGITRVSFGPQAFGLGAVAFTLLWLMSGGGYFWPVWPMLGLAAAFILPWLVRRPREQVLEERVDELARSRRGALDVQATELRRIERDLHDGAQARLVALSMKLGRAEDRYREDPQTAALLREAREDATAAIRELRELARGIAPPVLADRGLEAAVRSLADRTGADVQVRASLPRRPTPAVETAAYFVIAESLTNAAKHAPGTRIEVGLNEHGGDLFVEVTDFGPGGADPAGSGLTGLRQRVEALDGRLELTSPAGVGTQVEAMLPCGW
jgi:signal transduction histidine kinase